MVSAPWFPQASPRPTAGLARLLSLGPGDLRRREKRGINDNFLSMMYVSYIHIYIYIFIYIFKYYIYVYCVHRVCVYIVYIMCIYIYIHVCVHICSHIYIQVIVYIYIYIYISCLCIHIDWPCSVMIYYGLSCFYYDLQWFPLQIFLVSLGIINLDGTMKKSQISLKH